MNQTLKTVGAGLVGVALTASIAVMLPEVEQPATYVATGEFKDGMELYKITRPNVCKPFEYTATLKEVVEAANIAQESIDSGLVDERKISEIEEYKTRFIQDAQELSKINELTK